MRMNQTEIKTTTITNGELLFLMVYMGVLSFCGGMRVHEEWDHLKQNICHCGGNHEQV